MDQETRRLQLRRHVGQLELQRLELRQLSAELAALLDVVARRLQTEAGTADGTGADVQPATVQPHHRHLEADALFAQPVVERDNGVLEDHRAGGLAVPAELGFLLAEGDTGRVLRHHETRDAVRPLLSGSAHHDVDIGLAAAGDEGLLSVQDVAIAVALGPCLQVAGIGAVTRFGQAVAGELFHGHELGQPGPALRVAAEAVDHPAGHVVDRDVGRGRGTGRRQFLENDRRVQAIEPRAAHVLADVDPGKAQFRRLAQGLHGKDLAFVPSRRLGGHLLAGELARHGLKGLLILAQPEVHRLSALLHFLALFRQATGGFLSALRLRAAIIGGTSELSTQGRTGGSRSKKAA